MMDFTNLMLSEDEGLSVLLREFLPHPDQQRLACTCTSLAKQYAKPTLEPLKKGSEELFLLRLVSGEKEGEMFDYVWKGNYECHWIEHHEGVTSVTVFGSLREALQELVGHVENTTEPGEFWAWCRAENLECQRRRKQPLVCSSAFCVQTKNGDGELMDNDLHILKPGHNRAFCRNCLQDDWRLRYQFYRHCRYSESWDHIWWGWSKAFAHDSDDSDDNGEYRMSFYDDSDIGCGGSWKNEIVFVGGPAPACSTTTDQQSISNKSGSSG